MTARPIFRDSRRRPVHAAVALMLILVAVLLAAGCQDQTTVKKQTSTIPSIITITGTVAMMPVTTIPTICPTPANGSYWISINPIGNVSVGNKVLITGLTNIPPGGGTLHIQMVRFPSSDRNSPEINGVTNIEKSGDCVNTFTYYSDTTGLNYSRRLTRIDTQVYFSDSTLPDFNYPANQSKFYINSQVTPIITTITECPKVTSNDKKYLDQFGDSRMLFCNYLIESEEANKNTAGVSDAASDCTEIISHGPYPDNEKLRRSREMILSGYTKMVNGDLDGGNSDLKEGNIIRDDFSISMASCTDLG